MYKNSYLPANGISLMYSSTQSVEQLRSEIETLELSEPLDAPSDLLNISDGEVPVSNIYFRCLYSYYIACVCVIVKIIVMHFFNMFNWSCTVHDSTRYVLVR